MFGALDRKGQHGAGLGNSHVSYSMSQALEQEDAGSGLTLPPLRPGSKGSDNGEVVDNTGADVHAVSLTRRKRKVDLLARSLEAVKSSAISAGLEVPARATAPGRRGHKDNSSLITEAWLDGVLDPKPLDRNSVAFPDKLNPAAFAGLASAGLNRESLLNAGLSHNAVDTLHRALYVHSVGFFDSVRDAVKHSEHRAEVLGNVWRSFLAISETALKMTFRSEFLGLLQQKHDACKELIVAAEALAEAREGTMAMENAVAWLSASHAEERAMRMALKGHASHLQEELICERHAHEKAASKYVEEVELRQYNVLEVAQAKAALKQTVGELQAMTEKNAQLEAEVARLNKVCEEVKERMDTMMKPFIMDEHLTTTTTTSSSRSSSSNADRMTASRALSEQKNTGSTQGGRSNSAGGSSSNRNTTSGNSDRRLTGASTADTQSADAGSSGNAVGVLYNAESNTTSRLSSGRSVLSETSVAAEKLAADVVIDCAEEVHRNLEQLYQKWKDEVKSKEAAHQCTLDAQDACHKLRLELYDMQGENNRLEGRLSSSEKALHGAEANISRLALQLDSRESELIETTVKLASLQKDATHVREALASSEKRCNEIQMVMVQMSTKMEESRRVMIDKIRVADSYARMIGQLQFTSRNLGVGLSVAMSSLTKLQVTCSNQVELEVALKGTNIELTEKVSDQEKTIGRMESEIETFKEKVLLLEDEVVELKAAKRKSEATHAKTQREIEDKEKEMNEKNKIVMEMQKRVAKTEEELTTQMKVQYDLEQYRDHLLKKVETLEEHVQNLNKQLLEQSALCMDLRKQLSDAIRQRVDAASQAQEDMRLAREATRKVLEEKAEVQAELDGTQQQLDNTRSQLNDSSDKLAVARNKWTKWKSRTRQLQDDNQHFREMLLARNETVEALSTRIKTVEADLQAIAADAMRAVQFSSDDTEDFVDELTVTLKTAREKMEDCVGRLRGLEQQVLDVDAVIDKLFKERQKIKSKTLIEEDNLDELQVLLEKKQREIERATSQRVALEGKLQKVKEERIRLQAGVDRADREVKFFDPHTRLLSNRTISVEKQLLSEQGRCLVEAEERLTNLHGELAQQQDLFDELKALKARTDRANQSLSQNIDGCHTQIKQQKKSIEELEAKLKNCNSIIGFLQAEVANVKTERERSKLNQSEAESQLDSLRKELQVAQQALSGSLKRVEKKYEAERQALEKQLLEDVQVVKDQLNEAQGQLETVNEKHNLAESALKGLAQQYFLMHSQSLSPRWVFFIMDDVFIRSVGITGIPVLNPFLKSSSILPDLSFSSDVALKLISQIMVEKILHENEVEHKSVLDTSHTPRKTLEEFAYDFFLSRWGCRHVAEAHLAALMATLDNLAATHRRMAMFLRLLGCKLPDKELLRPSSQSKTSRGSPRSRSKSPRGRLQSTTAPDASARAESAEQKTGAGGRSTPSSSMYERRGTTASRDAATAQGSRWPPPPLPPSAVHTYLALLSRIHTRCGPMLSEATDGCSMIQMGQAVKVVREVLRGSYSSTVPEVAELTDRLRNMASGDEFKPLDLDIMLDMTMSAWLCQRQSDEAALISLIRHADGRGKGCFNADDFTSILKLVDHTVLAQHTPRELHDLFRQALRSSMGSEHAATPASCANILLENGIVGMKHNRLHHEKLMPPPYDEFLILEESWKTMKRQILEQLQALDHSVSLKIDTSTAKDLCRQFEDIITRRDNPEHAWALYRKLMTLYSLYRHQIESQPLQEQKPNAFLEVLHTKRPPSPESSEFEVPLEGVAL